MSAKSLLPETVLRNLVSVTLAVVLLSDLVAAQHNPKAKAPGNRQERPCTSPMTQPEENACSLEQYRKADRRLNSLFGKLLQSLQKDLTSYKHDNDERQQSVELAIQKLNAAKEAWIEYQKRQCEAAAQQYEHGTFQPTAWALCMKQTTKHRIEEIRQVYEIE